MKTKLFNSALVALFIMLSAASVAAEDYYREIKKSFAVNANVAFKVDIDFANTRVETWDKNYMDIVVKIDANLKSEKRAEEIFRSVNIEEGMASVYLSVDPKGGWKGSENVSIHVEVKMPKGASLSGSVSFGNVEVINPMQGKLDLSLDYGNLDAGELKHGNNDLSISFGNAKISSWNGGDAHVEYGNIKLQNITGNSHIEDDFGNIDIRGVSKTCKSLKVDCEYGNIDITTGGTGCNFQADVSYGDIDLNGDYKITLKETEMFSKAMEGTGNGGGIELEVDCSFGNIDLYFR